MRFSSKTPLFTFALLAACGATAFAQPTDQANQAEQAQQDQRTLDQAIEFLSDDASRIDAAEQLLGLDTAIEDSDDPLTGTYKLHSGFGKPRITISIRPNGDGTYEVTRIHEPRWGDTVSLTGVGKLGKKKTLTNKTRLLVDFPLEGGAAGQMSALFSDDECPEGNPSASYKLDPEIGRITGNFRSDQSMENTGSYESGWRVGVEPMSFIDRTKRSSKIIAHKIRDKVRKIRAKLAEQIASWREGGKNVAAKMREFLRAVRAKVSALVAKSKEVAKRGWNGTKRVAKRGWEGTKRVGRSIRNHTADAMDGTANVIHRGAEVVRVDD